MTRLSHFEFSQRLSSTRAWLEEMNPLSIEAGRVVRKRLLGVDENQALDQTREAMAAVANLRDVLRTPGDGDLSERVGTETSLVPYADGGRFLVFLDGINLVDGEAERASAGFFSPFNIPPPDVWVAYADGVETDHGRRSGLVCWVPNVWVPFVQRGIDINAEGCLLWAEITSTGVDASDVVVDARTVRDGPD